MNDHDDALRRALCVPRHEADPYEVLQILRPRMKRARTRRRAATATIAVSLVVGVTTGAFAMMRVAPSTTIRTSPISEVDERLPVSSTVTDEATDRSPDTAGRSPEPTSDDGRAEPIVETQESTAPSGGGGTTPAAERPAPTPPPAPPVTNSPAPQTPADNPADNPADDPGDDPAGQPVPTVTEAPPAATSWQTITSTCGRVVVAIDAGTVRIHSTEPEPGYETRVSTNGPESIELEFRSSDDRCELHAELEGDGLQVEVQNPEYEP